MPLTKTYLRVDTTNAVNEVLDNIAWLYMGGYFKEALRLLQSLSKCEAWEDAFDELAYIDGRNVNDLWWLLHWINGEPAEAIGYEAAVSVDALNARQAEWSDDLLYACVTIEDKASKLVGELKTLCESLDDDDELDKLFEDYDEDWDAQLAQAKSWEAVYQELMMVMQQRLDGIVSQDSDFVKTRQRLDEKYTYRLKQVVAVPSDLAALDTDELENLYFDKMQTYPDDSEVLHYLFIIAYLLENRPDNVTRFYTKLMKTPVKLTGFDSIWVWRPLVDYFASGALLDVLPLDDASVAAYVKAVSAFQSEPDAEERLCRSLRTEGHKADFITKPLATQFLHDSDPAKAVGEVLDNIAQLFISGYFEAGLQIIRYLHTSEAWIDLRFGRWTGANISKAEMLWEALHYTNGQPSEAFVTQKRRSTKELHRKFKFKSVEALKTLTTLRKPLVFTELGSQWNDNHLKKIRDGHIAARNVWDEFEIVLKQRLRQQIQNLYQTSFIERHGFSTRYVAESDYASGCTFEALEACLPAGFLQRNARYELFFTNYLLSDQPDLATRLFARLFAENFRFELISFQLWAWKPMMAYFASGALREVLRLNDAEVVRYAEAIKTRRTEPTPDPSMFAWEAAIRSYYEKCRCDFSISGVSDARLDAIEWQLNLTLPPSYKRFLKAADGMRLPGHKPDILPGESIYWSELESWLDPDEFEGKSKVLVISTSDKRGMFMLYPEIRYGEEWEALWSGRHGLSSYRSFAAMMQEICLKIAPVAGGVVTA